MTGVQTCALPILNSYETNDLQVLTSKIEHLSKLQDQNIIDVYKGERNEKYLSRYQRIRDQCEVILAISDNCETLNQLKHLLETIFSDKNEGVVLSSIHKAKGLENNRVFIYQYDSMPYRSCNPTQSQQELNIKYVAITRSKSELYLHREEDIEGLSSNHKEM